MSELSELIPTTELEAVNAVLAMNGTSPVEDITIERADVEQILNMLRSTSRSVQSRGWHFNTVRAVLLERDDDNEIPVPEDALKLRKTTIEPYAETQRAFDFSHRHGSLWNNLTNEPDFSDTEYDNGIYCDIVYLLNFEDAPETARQYIFIKAGRRYQEQAFGNADLSNFNKADEAEAFALLQDAEGLVEDPDSNKSLKDQRRANEVWNAVSRTVQQIGWHFNTRKQVALTPEDTGPDPAIGTVTLPDNTLRATKSNISSQWNINASHRGSIMYDVQNDTAVWEPGDLPDGVLKVDLVMLLSRDELPTIAKTYIDIKAARQLQPSKQPSSNGQVTGYTERDEFVALRDLQDAEGLVEDNSLLNSADVARVMYDRSSPYGGGAFDPFITR